ncbi:MAG: hypothetical protein Q8O39_00435 [bacterium]|nr:hypothetical protein [bacterium]
MVVMAEMGVAAGIAVKLGSVFENVFFKRRRKQRKQEQNFDLDIEAFLLKASENLERSKTKQKKAYGFGLIEDFFQDKAFQEKIMKMVDMNVFFMIGKELKESDQICRPYFWSDYIRGFEEAEIFCKKINRQ